MTQVTEVAPDPFRISTFVPEVDLQFNQFVVRDDEPLLFHTGLRKMFPVVRDAVAKVVDPTRIRITFSHFEADECGAGRYRFRYRRTPHARALRECAAAFREVLGGRGRGAA